MDTGAASGSGHPLPDLRQVRTRRDLARIINEAADPLEVKKEIMDEEQDETMEYDNEENFLEYLGPYEGDADQSMEDDEALLDEGDEVGDGGGDEGEEVLEEEEGSQDGEEDGGEIDGEYVVQFVAADEADGAALAEGDGSDPAAAPAAGPALTGGASPQAGSSRDDIGGVAADGPVMGEQETLDGTPGDGPGAGVGGGVVGDGGGDSEGDGEDDSLPEPERDEMDTRLRPDNRFFAVRALVEGGRTATKLNRRMKLEAADKDGFLVKGDERYFRNANESSIERRVNVSSSFTHSGRCHTCLNGTHDAWQGRQGQPVVMAAGDQHYPANLPARGDGECIRIL